MNTVVTKYVTVQFAIDVDLSVADEKAYPNLNRSEYTDDADWAEAILREDAKGDVETGAKPMENLFLWVENVNYEDMSLVNVSDTSSTV